MHICVLGAGVIGITSAYQLLQAGHQVSLIDALPTAGAGTSLGNGAQLSYSYVAPLADFSVWSHWPHYLFSSSSPLTLRPQLDPAQWRWLMQFLAACNTKRAHRTTAELLQLAFFSRSVLDQLRPNLKFDFNFRRAGKLVMFDNQDTLEGARRQIGFQATLGCKQELVDATRCVELEPALGNGNRDWAGGVYTASEEVGDCALFCRGLLQQMQMQSDFTFISSSPITGVKVENSALQAVITNGQEVDADRFVLAFGTDSPAFAHKLGFTLPIYPLKGYSITVPLTDVATSAAPHISITDLSRKIVYARLGERLRVAGRVELVGHDATIPERAITELKQATGELLPALTGKLSSTELEPWTGFRPATPSGVPIIGPSPIKNLFLNTGHGALGWTLACGSAAVLAAQIDGAPNALDISPFQL